jgi:ABC-2 type transport system ATP-binding protein
MADKNILVINKLNKKVKGAHILKDVSFVVPQGCVCAFIGHNGAGKTTTIKSIINLFQYDSGSILIDGINAKDSISAHNILGYVPERDFFPRLTGRIFLSNLCTYYGLSKTAIKQKIKYYSKVFDFEDKLDINMQRLSSGQKKKILIAQALLHNPKLIILDEPTENLDPDTRDIFYKVIKKHSKEGASIFISTHNLDEIQNYANYVVILVKGQVKYQG